jgi:MFS family permease
VSADIYRLPRRRGRPRASYKVTFAVLALGGLAFGLLQSMVSPALPVLQHRLHSSESSTAWLLTAYLLSGSVATPVVGRLGDIHGKQRVLVAVLSVLALGTVISAVATSLGVMVTGRVIQGVGEGMFPLAFGIINDEFPREHVAAGLGLTSAILGIGAGAGVVLSGVIVQHMSYHFLFWLPLIAVVAAAVGSALLIPESPVRAKSRIPWTAVALLSLGLVSILLAISEGHAWGWGSQRTAGLLITGAGLLGAWVLAELRSREPLVDMRVMTRPGVWTTNLTAALIGGGMFSMFILIPQFVELPKSTGFGFGASITGAGLFLLPATAMLTVCGALSGRIENRFGSKPPLVTGAVFATAGGVLMALAHSHRAAVYGVSALLGTGIGLSFAAMANLIVRAVPRDQVGVATGVNTISRTVGGAVGGQVVASLLASNLVAGTGLPAKHGFIVSFWVLAAVLAVATLSGFLVPSDRAAAEAGAANSASELERRAA